MVIDSAKFDLAHLIHAVNAVVTMNSTVGVQASVVGCPVIQVLGSIADDSVPMVRYGMAIECKKPQDLAQSLAQRLFYEDHFKNATDYKTEASNVSATDRIILEIQKLIKPST